MRQEFEYGAGGVVGILTPQSNTTVEPELAVLLPADTNMLVGRLRSSREQLADRLREYLETVGTAFSQLSAIQLDVLYFACTGACYELGAEREAELLRAAVGGRCDVISAAGAVDKALAVAGARRLAIVSPYPRWLTDACSRFWADRGFDVRQVVQIHEDNVAADIYGLRTERVEAALAAVNQHGVDAVLLAGTGMPTLGTLVKRSQSSQHALVLSANACMSWYVTQTLASEPLSAASLQEFMSPAAQWSERFALRFPRTFARTQTER